LQYAWLGVIRLILSCISAFLILSALLHVESYFNVEEHNASTLSAVLGIALVIHIGYNIILPVSIFSPIYLC
jgi:hypothetical protein